MCASVMNWPAPLSTTIVQLKPQLNQAAVYLEEHPQCANGLFALAAVCGAASPLYLAARDIMSLHLGEDFPNWATQTERADQIVLLARLGGLNVDH